MARDDTHEWKGLTLLTRDRIETLKQISDEIDKYLAVMRGRDLERELAKHGRLLVSDDERPS